MRVTRHYRKSENVEEVHMHNVARSEYYKITPQQFEFEEILFPELLKNMPMDIHILAPYEDGKDFIILNVGNITIRGNEFTQSDVTGRLLSKVTPVFHEILYDSIFEVYKSHKIKQMRLFYYLKDNLVSVTNIKILYDSKRIFILTDYTDTKNYYPETINNMNKSNIMKYFSQKGKYSKVNGKYSWSPEIYTIINRPSDKSDEYYNIVFDLVIPQDRPLIDEIIAIIDEGVMHYEEVIRIQTHDGEIKYLEINFHSNFDDDGNLISHHGLINDITQYSNNIIKPVDLLMKGFKNSKLALLLEPLNSTQYEFSQGFYNFIETEPEDYVHSKSIFENIIETDVRENLYRLSNGELNEINETFTCEVNGRKKYCELYVESFEFANEYHSIGFLTDITDKIKKQHDLIKANETQKVLIKEIHHRVKNNLQILNSFLNLEKRVYKDELDVIINHMQSRLTSLAILHEKTYNTTDFKNINLNDYILDQDSQFKSLLSFEDDIEIISDIDKSINVSIEIITPLSLVINELMMNSIKHAFPDDCIQDKKIIKEIHKIDDDTAKLIIADNGIGMDDAGMNNNLGCEIVKNLTRQLNGKIRILNLEKGTGFELTFPLTIEHTITQ